jgi:hypothetical protein
MAGPTLSDVDVNLTSDDNTILPLPNGNKITVLSGDSTASFDILVGTVSVDSTVHVHALLGIVDVSDSFSATAPVVLADKVVFVTSQGAQTKGDMGGLTPDQVCQAAADAGIQSSLLPAGTYKAFISFTGSNAKDRIADGNYVLPDGTTVVAAGKSGLLSGTLQHAIDQDELGNTAVDVKAFTGTNWDGVAASSGNAGTDSNQFRCNEWATTSGTASEGLSNATISWWTVGATSNCNVAASLYCFQQ